MTNLVRILFLVAAMVYSGHTQAVAAETILRPIATVQTTAVGSFKIADYFKDDPKGEAGVRISLSSNFKKRFLELVDEHNPVVTLRIYRLSKFSRDGQIANEIGKNNFRTGLALVWNLLKQQGMGQDGVLLTDGRVNIFYISDRNSFSSSDYAVSVYWSEGWHIDGQLAINWWDKDNQVISR